LVGENKEGMKQLHVADILAKDKKMIEVYGE
jgi:hypothetical protein